LKRLNEQKKMDVKDLEIEFPDSEIEDALRRRPRYEKGPSAHWLYCTLSIAWHEAESLKPLPDQSTYFA
jgi:hypothetical protein